MDPAHTNIIACMAVIESVFPLSPFKCRHRYLTVARTWDLANCSLFSNTLLMLRATLCSSAQLRQMKGGHRRPTTIHEPQVIGAAVCQTDRDG